MKNNMNGQTKKNMKLKKKMRRQLLKYALISCVAFMILFSCFTLHGRATGNDAPKYKYYTSIRVEYGDTLWSIAGDYMDPEFNTKASYIKELKSINHIGSDDYIQEGKILIIPYYSTEYME